MTSETKKRISDINNGIIPEGYKKTKVGIVPVEWEECHFKKMFSILKNNTLSRAELNNENGNYQNIHYGDILTEYNTILDCSKVHIPFVNYEINVNTDTLINGDIVIADTAEDYTVGKLIEIQNIDNKKIVSGLHTIPCRPNKKTIPKWLGYYMDSFAFHNQLIPLITGTKVSSISKSELQKTVLVSPPLPEQQKIAEILSTQDKLIELQERKINQLKTLKKGYLQKMFPKKGSKYPELRFKGFTDAWEERKLGECVEFLDTMRKPLKESEREKGEYPYYGASGIVDYVSDYIFDEELVLLSEDGANITDRNYPVCFLASGKYWVNNHAHVLKPTAENENNFICNSLERMDFTPYNSGMAMPKLNKEVCHNIELCCPKFAEQKKIGDYFRNFDNLITLHQRKLDEEKQKKKALMQLLLTGKVRVI